MQSDIIKYNRAFNFIAYRVWSEAQATRTCPPECEIDQRAASGVPIHGEISRKARRQSIPHLQFLTDARGRKSRG